MPPRVLAVKTPPPASMKEAIRRMEPGQCLKVEESSSASVNVTVSIVRREFPTRVYRVKTLRGVPHIWRDE